MERRGRWGAEVAAPRASATRPGARAAPPTGFITAKGTVKWRIRLQQPGTRLQRLQPTLPPPPGWPLPRCSPPRTSGGGLHALQGPLRVSRDHRAAGVQDPSTHREGPASLAGSSPDARAPDATPARGGLHAWVRPPSGRSGASWAGPEVLRSSRARADGPRPERSYRPRSARCALQGG